MELLTFGKLRSKLLPDCADEPGGPPHASSRPLHRSCTSSHGPPGDKASPAGQSAVVTEQCQPQSGEPRLASV